MCRPEGIEVQRIFLSHKTLAISRVGGRKVLANKQSILLKDVVCLTELEFILKFIGDINRFLNTFVFKHDFSGSNMGLNLKK